MKEKSFSVPNRLRLLVRPKLTSDICERSSAMCVAGTPTKASIWHTASGNTEGNLLASRIGIPMKFHSGSTWRELDAWVNLLGVDAMTAIRAATYWPAVAMRKEREVGTISPGKHADVIAVRGDVLRYINLLQRVDIVVKRGTRYK